MHNRTHKRVLLLGETLGPATVGLLYLASYLRRHDIEAYCQWNDACRTKAALEENIRRMMAIVKPTLVGVSIKWFPHMARGLEICRLVKSVDPATAVVLGGNTASFYWREFINEPNVDFVIRGDGEQPLLQLCLGNTKIPNLVTPEDLSSPSVDFGYIQGADTDDAYLSHLDEIFVDPDDIRRVNNFFIYSGKRCNKKCFYCGGAAVAMMETYGSARPFFRGAKAIRNDLAQVQHQTDRFLFDFDFEPRDKSQEDYFREIFVDDWLTRHAAYFYFWRLPHAGAIEFLSQRFRHVNVSLDLASLSDRHRRELMATPGLGVKPQPSDADILAVFDQAQSLGNVTLDINMISGMPLLRHEDLDQGTRMVERLLSYSCLGEIQWGRLHAQPGAPILSVCEKFGMKTLARTYADFMKFSQTNLRKSEYPDWRHVNYPFIFAADPNLVIATTDNYMRINEMLATRDSSRRLASHD